MSAKTLAHVTRPCRQATVLVATHPLTWFCGIYLTVLIVVCIHARPENDGTRDAVWRIICYAYTVIAATIPLAVGVIELINLLTEEVKPGAFTRLTILYIFQPWAAGAGLYFFLLTWYCWKYEPPLEQRDVFYILSICFYAMIGVIWLCWLLLTMDGGKLLKDMHRAHVLEREAYVTYDRRPFSVKACCATMAGHLCNCMAVILYIVALLWASISYTFKPATFATRNTSRNSTDAEAGYIAFNLVTGIFWVMAWVVWWALTFRPEPTLPS